QPSCNCAGRCSSSAGDEQVSGAPLVLSESKASRKSRTNRSVSTGTANFGSFMVVCISPASEFFACLKLLGQTLGASIEALRQLREFPAKSLGRLERSNEMPESILERSRRFERCRELVQTLAE